MEKTMKRIVITDRYNVEIEETPIPIPGPGEILVKASISGISSGTEMMIYRGTLPNLTQKTRAHWRDYPIYPGYEMVGTVVAIGEDPSGDGQDVDMLGRASEIIMPKPSDFKIGDRVICFGEHGEYAISSATKTAKLPDSISDEAATLAVLGSTSMHSVRRADLQYGDVVLVIGMGVLGYLITQQAKNNGARKVIALDINDERLEYAKKAGVDYCINTEKEDPIKRLMEINGGILADVVFEVSGYPGTEQLACKLARARGKVMISSWHTINLDIDYGEMFNKELTLTSSCATGPQAGMPYTYLRWDSAQNLIWAVELFEQGKLKQTFTPSIFHYTQIKEVYDKIDKNDSSIGMQAILTWNKEE